MPPPITEFIKAHTRKVTTTPSQAPPMEKCQLVTRVAKVSVAGLAGVQKNDVLVAFQDRPANEFGSELYRSFGPERSYTFWSPRTRTSTRIDASGIEIGVMLQPTVESVLNEFEKNQNLDELKPVWRAGRWKDLEELSRFAMTGSRKVPTMFQRVLGRKVHDRRGTPATLFLGCALFEQGQHDEGLELIVEYMRDDARSWTTDMAGIGQFYLARAALAAGEEEEALGRLQQAWEYTEEDQVADFIEELTEERPEPEVSGPWTGERFPMDYELEPLGEKGPAVSFAARRRALPPGKLLTVCLLGSYRINGPYNDFMLRYRNFGHFFEPYMHELHVITNNPQNVAEEYADMLKGEESVRARKIPFALLLDRGGDVQKAVQPDLSPDVHLVTEEGIVLNQGWLESADLWDALAARYP